MVWKKKLFVIKSSDIYIFDFAIFWGLVSYCQFFIHDLFIFTLIEM